MDQKTTVKCSYTESEVKPYLFGFQNSLPSEKEVENCKSVAYVNHKSPEQVNVQIKTAAMEYKGTANTESPFDQLFIGIFDKKKFKLGLVKSTSIIPLVQKVTNLNVYVHDSEVDYRERRKILVDTFGNKKSKQIQRTYEIGTITMNNIVGADHLQGILKQKGETTEVPEFTPVKRSRNSGGRNKRR